MERGERYNPMQEARELADNQVEQDFFDGKSAAEINEGVRERADQRQTQREAEREYAEVRRETVDEVINSVVQLELEEFADRRLTPEEAKAEITQRLKELATKLFSTEDDVDRDQLTVERAVLLRTRQALENDRGVRELPTRVADALDMPDVSFQQSVDYPRHDEVIHTKSMQEELEEMKMQARERALAEAEGKDAPNWKAEELNDNRIAELHRVEEGKKRMVTSDDGTGVGMNPLLFPNRERPAAEATWMNEVPEQKMAANDE